MLSEIAKGIEPILKQLPVEEVRELCSQVCKGDVEPFITVAEAAERAHCNHMTIREFIRTGKLPARRLGGKILLHWSDVEKLIK